MILLLAIAGSCSKQPETKTGTSPNIILIYLDDMGYGDLSITGAAGYQTPNLDEMAGSGMFFTHFYSPQAVCSASRAGLITGCYPNRVGITGALSHNSKTGISDKEETLAEVLKKKGYATAIFGKWHLGFQQQFLPVHHGFDEFYGIPYSHDMWPLHPTGTYQPSPLPQRQHHQSELTPEDVANFTTDLLRKQLILSNKTRTNLFCVLAKSVTACSALCFRKI